ncbi:MAG: site-specific integrase [Lachnospiraceae bacterium]|nr:site-specific integrase [Lachnospiraceae bacterium]
MNNSNLRVNEILLKAVQDGIIDITLVEQNLEVNERKKYLDIHSERFKIWQGNDGKYYTYLPVDELSNKRKKVKKSFREDIEDAIIKHYKKQETNPTVEKVFDMWIDEKLEYGEITKQTYSKYKNNFIRFFKNPYYSIDGTRIAYVTEDMLEQFIRGTISKLELSQKAYADMRILINGIFKYAKRKKFTQLSISYFMGDLQLSKNIFSKKIKRVEDEIFLEEEIPQIIQYLEKRDDIHSKGLLLAFLTGVRVGELSALKISDINSKILKDSNIAKNYINIERTEIKYRGCDGKWIVDVQEYPKTDAGVRNIIVNDNVMELIRQIRQLNPFGEYLFMCNNKRIRGHAFNKKLGRVCTALGINKRTMHKIRKTYGTTLLDSNVDEATVAEMMGHKDISTTRKYYYYSNKSDCKKVEQITGALQAFNNYSSM